MNLHLQKIDFRVKKVFCQYKKRNQVDNTKKGVQRANEQIYNQYLAQGADEQGLISDKYKEKVMISDFAQTKPNKSKTQPNQQYDNLDEASEPYVNPVIKHTLQSLPLIYGGNFNRKRKYNVFMKNKLELNSIISRVHDRNYLPNQRLYKRNNEERPKGYSAFEMNPHVDHSPPEREENVKTVTKKKKRLATEPDSGSGGYQRSVGHSRAMSNEQKVHQNFVNPKSKRLVRLQSLDELAKPREKCNNQYCSCKSIYEEYQNEINKKIKQKMEILSASRKNLNQKINLPRLSFQSGQKTTGKLDDQESKHKVSFKSKINSMGESISNTDNSCQFCYKDKKEPEIKEKGILGLIKKKQLEQKKKKLDYYSKTQEVGISMNNMATQMTEPLASDAEVQNEEYGTQANLVPQPKKLATIDQEINTDFDQENHSFRHLENSHNFRDSALRQNKKQPMQHLSHLKEKYKYQKRPAYKSKYDHKKDEDDEKYHQNDQDSEEDPDKCQNPKHKKLNEKYGNQNKNKKKRNVDPLNTSNDSIISENSMMNHLANALASNGKDKNTIFKLLKRKEEESEIEGLRGSRQAEMGQDTRQKNKKSSKPQKQYKKLNLINESTGLFSIPEQQQYVDYLKGYQPIQKDFKIKEIVKSENFKILKYKDTIYFGQAKADNTKNGKALVISPKEIFEGVYENGVKMSGCQRNIDGMYMGQFLNGMRHGEGKWLWNNGQVYEGEWKLGTKNGFGTWKSPKGDSYEGQWVLNRQQGKGIHQHKNSVYEGEFVQALKQGHGRQKYINGDEYIGDYYKGRPHGKGKYIWKNGNAYEGQFKEGLRSGFGKWTYSNKAYYEGEFANDFKHGKGKQIFGNGDHYEGQYYEGQKVNGVYIEAATGQTKEIKVKVQKKINPKNEQKAKEKQASVPKSTIKPKQKEGPAQKLQVKEQPKQFIDIEPVLVKREQKMMESKVQIQPEEKEEQN